VRVAGLSLVPFYPPGVRQSDKAGWLVFSPTVRRMLEEKKNST